MKGFNECPNGHYYQLQLNQCPYCPSGDSAERGSLDQTIIDDGFDSSKTIVDVPDERTIVEQPKHRESEVDKSHKDLSKTYIKIDDNQEAAPNSEKEQPRAQKKLVGWLVSYTIDDMGRDFKLYEGKNSIGKEAINDIVVINDTTISGVHAVILFRNNTFYIKDNMSTNGSLLNEKALEPDVAVSFEDKAIIKLGDTLFYFRTALH